MARRGWQRGRFRGSREPVWTPLLEEFPEDIDDFMWMGEVVLTDGTRVQLYKHYWTRRHLNLDLGGRVFVSPGTDRWSEAEDAKWILEGVVGFGRSRTDVIGRNEWIDVEEIGWAPSATRHGVARSRSLHVVGRAGICWRDREFADETWDDPRFLFLGPDEDWSVLEVIGVVADGGRLMIVHAAPLGERLRGWYEEAEKWRK